MHYSIRAQMLEIYNESIRDLLVDNNSSSGGGPNVLQLLSTQPSGENVPGANKVGLGVNTAAPVVVRHLPCPQRFSADVSRPLLRSACRWR